MTNWRQLAWLLIAICGVAAPRLCAETVDLTTSCEFSGQVADINQTTQKLGLEIRVGMRGVSYSGQLKKTLLEQTAPGSVTLWFGLRNVRLTVKRTDIVGGPGSAACGPMEVVLGHQKDLWLAFDIEPDRKRNSSQMVVRKVRMELPPENWAIGRPAWVQTAGIGFTQQAVVDGLREGIAQDREKLRRKLMEDAPQILAQVMQQTKTEHAESPIIQAIRARLSASPQAVSAAE